MLEIKFKRLWWVCLIAMAASYPVSSWAANLALQGRVLPAPFLLSWLGVWVFAAAGGICAGFIRIPEIDKRFHQPSIAKSLLGLFSGVAICSLIDTFSDTQSGALAFFAFFASIFSAPLAAGVMVWLSNQKRIDKALNQVARQRTGVDTSIDTDFTVDKGYKRRDSND